MLLRVRPGDPAGGREEEGVGRPAGEQLEPLRGEPQPAAGEGRHRHRRRGRGGLVHRLLAEAEGAGARRGESPRGGEGPDGED